MRYHLHVDTLFIPSRSKAYGLAAALLASVALAACGGAEAPTAVEAPVAAPAVQESPESDANDAVMPEVEATLDGETVIRQADSHVHGAAALAMAVDGNEVTVELETPLYNLLGFEHAPDTPEQERSVADAEAVLRDPAAMFAFNMEAGCAVEAVPEVALFADDGSDHEHDDHEHADDHDHDHDHDDGDDDDDDDHSHDEDHDHDHDHDDEDHAHDHDHDDAQADGAEHDHVHKDALLTYRFDCAQPARLASVRLDLFEAFSELTEVELVYLGPNRQMSQTVTRDDPRVDLGG
ncbi:MAG: DUF2796 domain-containing protein [Litorimonas sp.]